MPGILLTHGRDTNQGRTDTSVETPPEAIAGNALLEAVDGALVDARLGGLEADLDQVKGVTDDDGADATKTARGERAQLRRR